MEPAHASPFCLRASRRRAGAGETTVCLRPRALALRAPDLPPRVLVVRPALVDRSRGRLAGAAAVVKEVLPQSRESIPAELPRWLGPGTAISARPDLP